MEKRKKVVVIGGGTGTIPVLTGLKQFKNLDLSVVVSMTDDGGSNAVIRDQFGLLPLSDLRKSIIALSKGHTEFLREIFTYRFSRGKGLEGHTLGNLILTGLADITGSEENAVQVVSELFHLSGRVIPVTFGKTTLRAIYSDGSKIEGEHLIDEPEKLSKNIFIKKLSLTKKVNANPLAVQAILKADVIIAGPGDLYTSTLANIIIPGIAEAIQKSKAKFIFISNLMTKHGQTDNFAVSDFIRVVTEYCGRCPDAVILHSGKISDRIIKKYFARGENPVRDDVKDNGSYKVIRKDVVQAEESKKDAKDKLVRSLIRHDAKKLARILYKIIY
jgi:uncharacterized cofD-like protein